MKGPSLRYDLRVLRVFHCDACGREAQAPGNATSHTCPCSDPPKFMRPLERPRTVSPDVSRFISPAEPEDTIEEVEVADEDYVPYVPILPVRPERFPNRRKLSDDLEKYQGTDPTFDIESVSQPDRKPSEGKHHDGNTRRDESPGGRGSDRGPRQDSRRDRPPGGDRSGARPSQDNRDRRDRGPQERGANERGPNDRGPQERNDRGRSSGADNARRERPSDRTSERGEPTPPGNSGQGRGGRGRSQENNQDATKSVSDSGKAPHASRPRSEGTGSGTQSGSRRSRGPRQGAGGAASSVGGETPDEFGSGLDPVIPTTGPPAHRDAVRSIADDADLDADDREDTDGEGEDGSSVATEGRAPRRRSRRRGRRRGRGQGGGGENASNDSAGPSDSAGQSGSGPSELSSNG